MREEGRAPASTPPVDQQVQGVTNLTQRAPEAEQERAAPPAPSASRAAEARGGTPLLPALRPDPSLVGEHATEATRGAGALLGDVALPIAAVVLSVALWVWGALAVDMAGLNDLGLVSVLTPAMLVAPALLTASFVYSLSRTTTPSAVLGLHVTAIVIMLYGVTALVETVPSRNVVWRHVGVVDTILRTHAADPYIDAYFNWPGFFMLVAFATQAAGLTSALPLAPLAPLVFMLTFLGPMLVMLRAVTNDRRVVWLAVWLFCVTNWVGQDYLAPQAFAYLCYLTVLAILVRWFHPSQDRVWTAALGAKRAGLMAVLLAVFAATVASHQLTPFAIMAAVTGLVVCRQCTARTLPVVMAVITVAWLQYMATTYLSGHLSGLLEQVGQLGGTVSTNVGERLQGSPQHLSIVRLRLVFTASVWLLAGLGLLRRWVRGHRDYALMALSVAPFALVPLQSYGGEMLLRVYLFGLPFVSFFAASALLPQNPKSLSAAHRLAVAFAAAVLLAGFLFARYGNARPDYFTPAEVAAVNQAYELAPEGSVMMSLTPSLPWKWRGYEHHDHETVSEWDEPPNADSVGEDVVAALREHHDTGALLILTESQRAYSDAYGAFAPGGFDAVEQAAAAAADIELVVSNADARVYQLKIGDASEH